MDCEYLKALSEMFASTDIEEDNVSSQNEGEPSTPSNHKQIAKVETASDVPTATSKQAEVQESGQARENPNDSKFCPNVEFNYSQDLRVQDIFLPHSRRTPSSSSCEWLIVTVKMPAEVGTVKDIEADVKNRRLVVNSPMYFLDVYLPQPPTANPDCHRAKWDNDKKQLVVEVKLERELDSIQFNSFIFLHKQVRNNEVNIMLKITSMEKRGHTELVNNSLKLIAGKIDKRRQLFRLLAELKPYANNHKFLILLIENL